MNLKLYNKLLADASSFLLNEVRLSYSTVNHYRCAWHHLRDYMDKYGILNLSKDICDNYFLERFGTKDYAQMQQSGQRREFSAIIHLIDFKETGSMKSKPPKNTKINYIFENEIGKCINDFISRLRADNISELSINKYERYLFILNLFLKKSGITAINQLTPNILLDYVKSFDKNEPPYRIMHCMATLTRFIKFLYTEGLTKIDLSKRIPRYKKITQPHVPTTYTKEEVFSLLASIDRRTAHGKRNYAIILLAARLGLRLSDIRDLRFENIKWEENMIIIQQYKTGKNLSLPLLVDVGNAIYDYVKYGRRQSKSQYVFIPERSEREKLLTSSFYNIFLQAFIRSGVDIANRKRGPHSLRHSLSLQLLEQNTPIHFISEVLGHESTNSTKYYLRVDIFSMGKCVLQVLPVPVDFYEQKGGVFYE